MYWQLVGTSLARHWPMGQKRIRPMKEAIGGPMRRHSLAIHWPNQVMLSGILLGPDRLLSQSTATLANTPECCGKTLLPMWEADCAAAQLCCFSIPSRGTVGNAKHPGPRQYILRTSYVRRSIERPLTGRYNVIAGFFTAYYLGYLLESQSSVQPPQINSLSDAKQSRRSVASSQCVSKRQ